MAFRRVINEHNPPELLASGIINLEDVDKLFKIFYDHLNVFLSIIDPIIPSPVDVYNRCPFLFIASTPSARTTTPRNRSKSVEIYQAYIVMSIHPLPARRWEEDRSWLYLRLTFGMATDLAPHIPSSTTKFIDERHEREILNRTRAWVICFSLDCNATTQFGKPLSIKEDSIIRSAATRYKKSVNNHCHDTHMVAYTSLQVESKFGFRGDAEIRPASIGVNFCLSWTIPIWLCSRLASSKRSNREGWVGGDMFLTACPDPASSVLRIVIEVLAPSGYHRYAADGHFVFAAFASAFLVK
ncbi:hypothetical protein FRB99_004323, partial [Tulasnella sp. 403]